MLLCQVTSKSVDLKASGSIRWAFGFAAKGRAGDFAVEGNASKQAGDFAVEYLRSSEWLYSQKARASDFAVEAEQCAGDFAVVRAKGKWARAA